jgi:hypothetical protein
MQMILASGWPASLLSQCSLYRILNDVFRPSLMGFAIRDQSDARALPTPLHVLRVKNIFISQCRQADTVSQRDNIKITVEQNRSFSRALTTWNETFCWNEVSHESVESIDFLSPVSRAGLFCARVQKVKLSSSHCDTRRRQHEAVPMDGGVPGPASLLYAS